MQACKKRISAPHNPAEIPKIGDAPGTRTPNLVIKSHLLCQLS